MFVTVDNNVEGIVKLELWLYATGPYLGYCITKIDIDCLFIDFKYDGHFNYNFRVSIEHEETTRHIKDCIKHEIKRLDSSDNIVVSLVETGFGVVGNCYLDLKDCRRFLDESENENGKEIHFILKTNHQYVYPSRRNAFRVTFRPKMDFLKRFRELKLNKMNKDITTVISSEKAINTSMYIWQSLEDREYNIDTGDIWLKDVKLNKGIVCSSSCDCVVKVLIDEGHCLENIPVRYDLLNFKYLKCDYIFGNLNEYVDNLKNLFLKIVDNEDKEIARIYYKDDKEKVINFIKNVYKESGICLKM